MSSKRKGNVVLEPLPAFVTTAAEARAAMDQLEECVPKSAFASKGSVTVRCFQNEVMTREYAEELYRLITGVYGVPVVRFIGPTRDAAVYLVEAATTAGRPESVQLFVHDGARVNGLPLTSLGDYLENCGN